MDCGADSLFLFLCSLTQIIAEVVEASIEDYEEGMQACNEAAKLWMQVYSSP